MAARPAYARWRSADRTDVARPGRVALLGACFALALASRLAPVETALTTDETLWIERTERFAAALERSEPAATFRSGHPGVTVMWLGVAGAGLERLAPAVPPRRLDPPAPRRLGDSLELLHAARSAVSLATAALTALLVALAWRLLGPGAGLAGGAIVLLDPYLVGVTRLLHPDALLAPLMAVSLLAGLVYFVRRGPTGYLVLSAAAGGLALLTKAPAVVLPAYIGLAALAASRSPRGADRLRPLLLWTAIAAVLYLALWPAMWVEPAEALARVGDFARSTAAGPHALQNFFLGAPRAADPGPLYYPVALAYRLGPVAWLGLLALALLIRPRQARFHPVLWLVGFVVVFLAVMSLGAKKFDRYALPAIVILDLLAGIGLWCAARRLTAWRRERESVGAWERGSVRRGLLTRSRAHALTLLLLVPLLALQAALLVRAYPHPLAAYNPLLGGAAGARQAILVGWGEGLEQVAAYLDRQPRADRLVATTTYWNVLRPLFRGATVQPDEPAPLDYYVVYVNMAQRELVHPAVRRAIASRPPEFTAVVHGVEYAWVYRVSGAVDGHCAAAPACTQPDD